MLKVKQKSSHSHQNNEKFREIGKNLELDCFSILKNRPNYKLVLKETVLIENPRPEFRLLLGHTFNLLQGRSGQPY